MILTALLLSLPPVAGSSHAALHPADATFFVEVPDAPALLEAYGAAPLVRMLADEKVLAVLGGFGVSADSLALGPALQGALAQGLPDGVDPAFLTRAAAASVSLTLPAEGGEPRFQAIIDYPSAELAAQVASLAEASHAERQKAQGSTEDGMRFVAEGSRVIATNLAEGAAVGLDADATYARCGSGLSASSGVTVVQGFSRLAPYDAVQAAARVAGEPLDPQIERLRGIGGMGRFRMQMRGDRFVTELFMPDDGERKGRVLGGAPVHGDMLAAIPPGQMLVYSTTLDGKAAGMHVGALLGEAGPKIAALLERIGPGFVAYAEPMTGIGLPRSYSWIELQNAEGFQDELTALINEAGAAKPGLAADTREYRVVDEASGERLKIPVTTISLPPELTQQLPIPGLSPSFAVHDGKLLVCLSSMHLKKELKRLYSGDVVGSDPLAQSGFRYPDDVRSVLWMDWAALVDGLVNLTRTIGPMLAGFTGGELPFDLEKIPAPQTFTHFFRPTFHYSRRVEGGEYRYHEASFGPETWFGLGGMAFAASSAMSNLGGMPMGGMPMGGAVPMDEGEGG